MTQEDPSDRFLRENLQLVADTPERFYLIDEVAKMVVASWKQGRADVYDLERFQYNAMLLADLIKTRQPSTILVDCRHLGFGLSYEDQLWYVQQTRAIWEKNKIKKIGFVFKANLTVQAAMEGLKEVAHEEGLRGIEYRIFECNVEAANWLRGSR